MRCIWIDPPAGWRYGFPKKLDQSLYAKMGWTMRQWFLDNGYPEEDVDLALKYSRSWDATDEE